jgi:hypothetical protein
VYTFEGILVTAQYYFAEDEIITLDELTFVHEGNVIPASGTGFTATSGQKKIEVKVGDLKIGEFYVAVGDIIATPSLDTTGVKTSAKGTTDAAVIRADDVHDAKVEATVDYTANYVDGELVGVTVDGVALTFVGDAVDTFNHSNIDGLNFHFGEADACFEERILAYVDIKSEDIAPIGASLVVDTYDNHDDEDECKLVKSIYIKLEAENGENYYDEAIAGAPDIDIAFAVDPSVTDGGWYRVHADFVEIEVDVDAEADDIVVINGSAYILAD